MKNLPEGPALLRIARDTLLTGVRPALDEEGRYTAAMIANAMAIAAREADMGDAPAAAALARLDRLAGLPPRGLRGKELAEAVRTAERRLASAIRGGNYDAPRERQEALLGHLRASVTARLRISNPKLLPTDKRGDATAPVERNMSFEALTPSAFLRRAGHVYAARTAVIDGDRRYTYAQLLDRTQRLAGALRALGAVDGARIAVLAPNTHVLLEAHYGVPFAGAVLVALNPRLTAADLAGIVTHAGASILIYDHELKGTASAIAQSVDGALKLVCAGGEDDEYEALLRESEPFLQEITDERGLLAINYTSGTTGRPKGVMYHHRGAYLQALAMAFHMRLDAASVFLWTLPMFHCNGWCFTWAVTAAGGTHVCVRKVEARAVWEHLESAGVTHFNAAPTVLIALAAHAETQGIGLGAAQQKRRIRVATGGAPPTPSLLAQLAASGMDVTHLYGLTETFGPSVICDCPPDVDASAPEDQARFKARQGVGNVISQALRIIDSRGNDVPADAATLGEIAIRGNNVMLGYYRDAEATHAAAPDGWFRTGDLAVMHPDGYVEIRDRAKDIIISGGENIASIEVERALATHPAVLEAAVVAGTDPKWGEVPVAFVTLKPGAAADADALIAHTRERLAHFKAPKRVVFGELPKNATGKIQKFVLRERARQT